MSASSISTAAAAALSFSISNNQFPAQCSQIHLSNSFPSKPRFPKPFRLKTLNANNTFLSFPLLASSLPSFVRLCSGSESPETNADDEAVKEDSIEEDEGEEEGKDAEKNGEEGRLYAGNLPFAMTSFELEQVFSEAGKVVNVQIVLDKNSNKSRGFAFITMGSNEEAKEAIKKFDGSQIGGRTAKVNFPEVPMGGERKVIEPKIRNSYRSFIDSPHKIYAGNLGWSLTSHGLKIAFANQTGLISTRVVYDKVSGRSRGFGFVTFESAESVRSALNAMNGVEVEGRPLRLSLAEERASSSWNEVVSSINP